MASMRQTSPGVWQIRVYVGLDAAGRRKYRQSTFRGGERAAKRATEDFASRVRREQAARPAAGTLADLLARWLAHARPNLERSTFDGYQRLAAKITDDIGELELADVTVQRLDAYYRELLAEDLGDGRHRSASTVGHYHAVLRRALTQAARWGEISSNPAKLAEPPVVRRREIDPPSPAVADELVRALAAENPDLATFIFVALATGMRRGELVALRWEDVDLDQAVVRVHRAIVVVAGELVEKGTKTHQARLVDLDDPTVEVLRRHRAAMAERAERLGARMARRPVVFSDAGDCGAPWHPDTATNRWRRFTTAQGHPGVRLHDLRHAMATAWLDAGIPVHVVSQRLGHAKVSTTTDIYAHVPDGSQARAAKRMGRRLPKLEPVPGTSSAESVGSPATKGGTR